MKNNLFYNRKLLIATKHQKENVIAPLLEKEFGVKCFTSDAIDTDKLGTFSGEIERTQDAVSTARLKCDLANKITGCDLIIASEGSFGIHPSLFIAQADEEILLLKDYKNDIEIIAKEISLETVFMGQSLNNINDLEGFLKTINYPSHGVILKSTEKNFKKVYKDFGSKKQLLEKFKQLTNEFGSAYIETDMRAMHNPTRMRVIERTVLKLVSKLKTLCPECTTPGYDVVNINPGLRCSQCNLPTKSTLSLTYSCQKCSHNEEKLYPRNVKYEDPTYCDYCNP